MHKLFPQKPSEERSQVVADLGDFVTALHLTDTGVLVAALQDGRIAFVDKPLTDKAQTHTLKAGSGPMVGLLPWQDRFVTRGWQPPACCGWSTARSPPAPARRRRAP